MSRLWACRLLCEVEAWQLFSSRTLFCARPTRVSSSGDPSPRPSDERSPLHTQHVDADQLQGGLAQLSSGESQALPMAPTPSGVQVLPAVVQTPAVLENAVSELQKEMVQDHPKRFRQLGKLLVQNLKMKSLSKHRGGLQPNFYDAKRGPRPAFRGSERQEEKRALKALAELGSFPALSSDSESLQRAFQSHPSYDVLRRSAEEQRLRAQARHLVPNKMYNGLGALAYATARLPSTYAAVRNVLQRLKMSRGDAGWVPETMLDFGSGPGTAGWAARSVWPSASIRVTNVEGSASMSDVGYQILRLVDEQQAMGKEGDEQDRGETYGHGSTHRDDHNHRNDRDQGMGPRVQHDVRWVRGLPRDRIENKYDICVASYSMNELRGPVERHQLLNRLMRSAKEYIVLVEHGTPHGFAIIEDSRRYVLKVSRKLGIPFHVAAPCPHDGACPLRDTRAWCHFSQRHTRTVEQRVAVRSLTGKAPRDTYAERFSYVVLRRGLRNANSPLLTSRGEIAEPDSSLDTTTSGDELLDINRMQEIMLQQVRHSRILRRRKRKGHVVLDLCSVLNADGSLIEGGSGTILRQTVSKGKSKAAWDGGRAYKASKVLSQGDEWPLVFQASRGQTVESPVIQGTPLSTEYDSDAADFFDVYGEDEDDEDEDGRRDGWSDEDLP